MKVVSLQKYILLLVVCACLCACGNYKRIVYFRDLLTDSTKTNVALMPFKDPVIQPDDILSIDIQNIDSENSASINKPNSLSVSSNKASTQASNLNGYLVDKHGVIELPMLGKVNLLGLTTFEARDTISKKASKFFKEPTVQVRFSNFKITVLGEVQNPAPYIIPNEKVSILDAIGFAGDLTVYGKRENVLLIRENKGKKEFYRFNLNSSETFKSPAFYLHQNDIIYVEGNKAKAASLNVARTQNISILTSLISVFAILITRF